LICCQIVEKLRRGVKRFEILSSNSSAVHRLSKKGPSRTSLYFPFLSSLSLELGHLGLMKYNDQIERSICNHESKKEKGRNGNESSKNR